MAGKIRHLINSYVSQMSKGNAVLERLVASKLCLQGIIPQKYDENSPDDPAVIEKITSLAKQANITL
ncbi:hypothetical protein [Candidatus Formimonas warabiya]|uniref:Uncharacterized protein n=1 Tax=Formimonas warabiya TaxID=1761012 RepID=A0A3G1KQ32_FORW1|nr:hypothetical protein [Candidatus Formimonas warabiya]ATW24561.1 hypothetical protein DCMF_06980 [Candidatus Formimonas warabiya]